MLKLLSRITLPTEGRIELHGRTTSLLEVGTGFHPELTGRENIFLNGTLLGLSRWEIFDRYEEIVEFSGIRPFIDTPVKRYSSGMFVRLAFSVAAHLDPEILIIDEVLAVGDMDFQRRSSRRCTDAVEGGRSCSSRTICPRWRSLCDRVLVLERGQIVSESARATRTTPSTTTWASSTPERAQQRWWCARSPLQHPAVGNGGIQDR
jgi:lipopolysaccharide transport system ATP-binding protein